LKLRLYPNNLTASRKKERNEGISEKSNKQTKAIDNIANENVELRELIDGKRQ